MSLVQIVAMAIAVVFGWAFIGWLVKETDTYILLASSYDWDAEQWGDLNCFPKYPPEMQEIK